MKHYHSLAEEILSKDPDERVRYLNEVKNKDLEFYQRIEHLVEFLTSSEELLEKYASGQIKSMLEDFKTDGD